MKENRLRIGITHGDINGIGYEIILKTLVDLSIMDYFTPIVYGSSKAAAFYRKQLNNEGINSFNFNIVNSADEAHPKRANIINVPSDNNLKVEPGVPTHMAGEASVSALEAAVLDLKAGKIDVVVTCPINKATVHSEAYEFPGHTEFLAARFEAPDFMMLMVSDMMRIGFVTSHIALNQVSKVLNKELILNKLSVMNQSIRDDFMIRSPRIAVLALNPHASDDGLLGDEEKRVIIPAIESAKANGILAFGPYPADGFFARGMYDKFDAVLAMYHDQGMIPFKSVGLGGGVNYTAGLPIVRTSPAHGTAYDIAGKDLASPSSLREAIFLARDIYFNRKMQEELNANPLKKQQDSSHGQGNKSEK